jgi:hypothetical protein
MWKERGYHVVTGTGCVSMAMLFVRPGVIDVWDQLAGGFIAMYNEIASDTCVGEKSITDVSIGIDEEVLPQLTNQSEITNGLTGTIGSLVAKS